MSGTERRGDDTASGRASRLTTWHQDLFTAVGRWPWLRTLDEGVAGALLPLYDRHRGNLAVELMHGGRWAGHSVHTALSDLPIGFWSGAIVLDLLGKDVPAGRDRLDPAATLSAAGLAAAVGTVATGVTDWSVSDGEDRRVGLFHGLLNVAGVALQAASLAARLTGHRRPAQVLGVGQHDRDGGGRLRRRAPRAGPGGHGQPGRRRRPAQPVGPRHTRGGPAQRQSRTWWVEGRQILLHRGGERRVRAGRHLQPRGWPAQPRRGHRLRRHLPAARVPVRPAGRAHRARTRASPPARAPGPDPQRLDRGSGLPASSPGAPNQRRSAWRGKQ